MDKNFNNVSKPCQNTACSSNTKKDKGVSNYCTETRSTELRCKFYTETEPIKKCPFCGAIPEIEENQCEKGYIALVVHDKDCFIYQRYSQTGILRHEINISSWNKRG